MTCATRISQFVWVNERERGKCDVAGYHLASDSFSLGLLARQPEVKPVAGIVLNDDQHSVRASTCANTGEHGIHRGRCEDAATHRSGQHAVPEPAAVAWLVPRATPGQEGDLRCFGLLEVGAEEDVGAL